MAAIRIEMFGGLRVRCGARTITRFRTRKAGAMLSYLALHPGRSFAREFLVELFWREADIEKGRMSLRTELASLRRQLEPPGVPQGTVLSADPATLGINSAAVCTDVAEFSHRLRSADEAEDAGERARLLAAAISLYSGELLSGYDEEWITPEREHLLSTYITALRRLTRLQAAARQLPLALESAWRAVQADPLNEDAHGDLIRLYLVTGDSDAAAGQMQRLLTKLREEMACEPSQSTLDLADEVRRHRRDRPRRPHAAAESPPLPSQPAQVFESPILRTRPANPLPPRFTRFFGRDREVDQLVRLLHPSSEQMGARVCTLVGPGGTGKTRLALESAELLAPAYGGEAWFVPLEEIRTAEQLPRAIAESLGIEPVPSFPITDQIVASVSDCAVLLVLDNCEQVAESAATIVQRLISRAAGIRFLVTSRRPLSLPGERQIAVQPLAVPGNESSPERLLESPSVQLYADRAQAVRADFQVTNANAGVVASLCRRLEGVPLALELAAARAQVLTPAQTDAMIGERFRLLATRRTDKASRHRSLWATIDWSYELLAPELQRFFTQLSVFRGGWTADAARVITEEPRAFDFLGQLRGHSMVVLEDRGSDYRYTFLDSLREFAAGALPGDEGERLRRRHTAYFVSLAEDAASQLTGPEQKTWLDTLEAEHDNLRAALEWGRAELSDAGLRISASLFRFWDSRGHWSEGRSWCAEALRLSHTAERSPTRGAALYVAGMLAYRQGDNVAAKPLFEESLEIAKAFEDRNAVAKALHGLGNVAMDLGEFSTAQAFFEESLAIRRETGDLAGVAASLNNLGTVLLELGDYALTRSHHRESLSINRELGDQRLIAYSLINLARVDAAEGHWESATSQFRDVLGLLREIGDQWGVALVLNGLGEAAFVQGDGDPARTYFDESLELAEKLGDRWGVAVSRHGIGLLSLQQEDFEAARAAFSESLVIRKSLGDLPRIAATLESIASLELATSPERAATLLGAAARNREMSGAARSQADSSRFDRCVAAARAALADGRAFDAAWRRGAALSLDEVVELALAHPR